MKNIKLILCIATAATFIGFYLCHSSAVTGQASGEALAAPTGVTASDSSYTNKVMVEWDTIRGATTYRVFRNTVNDPNTAADIGSTAVNSFLDMTVPVNQTNFYWVRAENASTAGVMSASDQGTRVQQINPPPPGFPLNPPPPPAPGNPTTATKVYLGKALFWDEQMSSTRTVSCGSCHHSGNGGTDPRSVTAAALSENPGFDGALNTQDDVRGSRGVPNNQPDGTYVNVTNYGLNDQVTGRKTVSYVNAGYPQVLFWDGRALDSLTDPITGLAVPNMNVRSALESQVLSPPVSTAEMGHNGRNWNDVAMRIASSTPLALSPSVPAALNTWINGRTYPELFLEAFGTSEVTPTRIAMAIAAFERTLYTDRAPVDLDAAGITPLSASAQRGRGIFNGPGNCNACHVGPLFTDNQFHDIGVRPEGEDTGRFQVTGNPADIGSFRTPSLRNVDLRRSFFHNGKFITLEDVVDFYTRGGDFAGNANHAPAVRPFNLGPAGRTDLVNFLHTLTDPRLVNEEAPFDRPLLYMESDRVPQAYGSGRVGSGGITPQIRAISPPVAGNPNFTVSVSSALGNATARLIIGVRDRTNPLRKASGIELYNGVVATQNTGAGNGWASISIPIPENASRGQIYYARWFIQDPSAVGGYSMTQAMTFTIFAPSTYASSGTSVDDTQQFTVTATREGRGF